MGVDELGVDEMGVCEMGSRRSGMTPFCHVAQNSYFSICCLKSTCIKKIE